VRPVNNRVQQNNKKRRRRRKSFSFFFPFKNSLEIDSNPFSFLFTKNTRDHCIIRESEKLGEALSCFVFSCFVLFCFFVLLPEQKEKEKIERRVVVTTDTFRMLSICSTS